MTAEQFKRSPHRVAWEKFLASEAGIAFYQTFYGLMPNTTLAADERGGKREILAIERLGEIRGYNFATFNLQFLSQPMAEKKPALGEPGYESDNIVKLKESK